MAKRKTIDVTGIDGAIGPQATPEQAAGPNIPPGNPPEADSSVPVGQSELPSVESPSISPATPETVGEPDLGPAAPIAGLPAVVPQPKADADRESAGTSTSAHGPRFVLRRRHMHYARLAASVAIGAVLGAIGGTLLTGGLATTPAKDVAAQEESRAMQQSVALLAKEVTTLKTNLDATSKFAHSRVASIDRKLAERLARESADITGSIAAPQTVAAAAPATAAPVIAPAATVAAVTAPVPVPTPRPRLAMAESQPPARPPVVRDWSIHDARGGYIYVESHGDIFQIVPGAPLPGLGPVESVRRLDGRWVVTTPKGIIVSMRDRRYFE